MSLVFVKIGSELFKEDDDHHTFTEKVKWPSGLRRQLKALVRKGEGSNPSFIKLFVGFKLN